MKSYFFKILKKLHVVSHINLTTSLKINGKKLKIPVIHGLGYQHFNAYEVWFTSFLKKLLPHIEGGVIDVGVNIGQTLIKIASIDSTIPYIGFEPNSFAFCYSYNLVQVNQLNNFQLYNIGLSKQEEILTLHMDNYQSSGASVLPNIRENMSKFKIKMKVPVFAGDNIFKNLDFKAGLIKIDVEGAELEVLQGMKEFIKNSKPYIILEILPVYNIEKENGRQRKERELLLISFLKQLDYTMFRINEHDITITELTEIEIHGKMRLTNYIFVPTQKVQEIKSIF